MARSSEELNRIAAQAEADLNSTTMKTGKNRGSASDEAGVDTSVENRFPGAEVRYGSDLKTNAGYNRQIPPEEGGELDDRGRPTRGQQFEGQGGPEDKLSLAQRNHGGENDNDVLPEEILGRPGRSTKERRGKDMLEKGLDATKANVGRNPPGVGGGKFKGEDYYTPESVPDSIADQGEIPPESVIQASKNTEGYE